MFAPCYFTSYLGCMKLETFYIYYWIPYDLATMSNNVIILIVFLNG